MDLTNTNIFSALTPEQKEERKLGIGGSDAAAVLGRSRYKTPLNIYNEKLGYGEEFNGNLSTAMGDYLEDFVRELYAKNKDLELEKPKDAIVHSEYYWMRCNLDFISADRKNIGEIKMTSNAKDWGEEQTDDVPIEALIQCAHNRIVAADRYGIDYQKVNILVLIVGFGPPKIREYVYNKNEKLEQIIISKGKDLWQNHVEKQIPPEHSATMEKSITLDNIIDDAVLADENAISLFQKHKMVSDQLAELKEEYDAIKDEFSKMLDNKTTLVDDNGNKLVTWKPQTRNRFDTTTFKKEEPELYKKFAKQLTVRPMRFGGLYNEI